MPGTNPDTEPSSSTPSDVDRRTLQKERKKARKQRRKWLRRTIITLTVLIVLAGATATSAYLYLGYRFHQIKKAHVKHLIQTTTPGKPFNVLLVGSDSRSFVSNAVQSHAFGSTTTAGGQRSDVTIVARFVPATKQVWLLSIPRDLWVDIPGHSSMSGPNRINAAYNTGPDLLTQTLEHVLDIPINHYIEVNFQGFQSMVTALGGVTMNFPLPVRDSYSGLHVTQTGCQLVGGATALELVRARHLAYEETGEWKYDGLSDFSRIQRQDAFFRALISKLDSEAFNPLTINAFLGATVGNVTIDDTFTEGNLFNLAEEYHGATPANLHTETLPTYSFTTSTGAAVLDEAQPYATDMISAFDLLGTSTPAPAGSTPATASTSTSTTTAGGGPTTSTTQPTNLIPVPTETATSSTAPASPTSTAGTRPQAAKSAHSKKKNGKRATASSQSTTTTVPPSTIQVKVQNGVNFTQPIASNAANGLRSVGFKISAVENAARTGAVSTVIEYSALDPMAADTVEAHLTGPVTLAPETSLGLDQVVVVVGSGLKSVTVGAVNHASTSSVPTPVAKTITASTTTTTIAPPPPSNVYTNTQVEPWNPVDCTL